MGKKKIANVKQFLDDEASESGSDTETSSLSEMASVHNSDAPVVVASNLDGVESEDDIEQTPAPLLPPSTPVKRKRVPALETGDSMYANTTGVKASTLGPPLRTRASHSTLSSGSEGGTGSSPTKKQRRAAVGDTGNETLPASGSEKRGMDTRISWSPSPPPSLQPTLPPISSPPSVTPPARKKKHSTASGSSAMVLAATGPRPTPRPLNPKLRDKSGGSPVGSVLSVRPPADPIVADEGCPSPTTTTTDAPQSRHGQSHAKVSGRFSLMEDMIAAQSTQFMALMSMLGKQGTPSSAEAAAPPSTPAALVPAPSSTLGSPFVPKANQTPKVQTPTSGTSQIEEMKTLSPPKPEKRQGKATKVPDIPVKDSGDVPATVDSTAKLDKGKEREIPPVEDTNMPDEFAGLGLDLATLFSPKKKVKDEKVKDEDVPTGAPTPPSPSKKRPKGGKVLDDLIYQKVKYDDTLPCQVSNPALQDPLLVKVYAKAPNLPNFGSLLPTYDPPSTALPADFEGGHVAFGLWAEGMDNAHPVTILRAVSVVSHGFHVNGALANPNDMCVMPYPGPKNYQILGLNEKVAVFMSCGACSASSIVDAEGSNSNSPRYIKFIAIHMHNQHWERFVQFCLVCFGHKVLYTHMRDRALMIESMLSPYESGSNSKGASSNRRTTKLTKYFPTRPGAASTSAEPSPSVGWVPGVSYPVKSKLDYTDKVPAYDARGVAFNFTTDLANLSNLPPWEGEVPPDAFVVVGHTVSTYQGIAGIKKEKEWHLGNNLLWVVVCGTASGSDSGSEASVE
ncbi:hypothetical protein C8R46DRAFT_1048516 [Mycena filopes]|nr:hypothetical protein C8R46DRAFT_1048516 [Mycena filopes]